MTNQITMVDNIDRTILRLLVHLGRGRQRTCERLAEAILTMSCVTGED